jgi:chitinase
MDSSFIYPELIYTAHLHGVKVIVSLGGWGRDKGFGPMAAGAQARKRFVENLTDFCIRNGYDGADLDWEYPLQKDRENFVRLISELRQAFDKAHLEILTAALPSKDYRNGYDIERLKDKLSWFGIMTYDFHGAWTSHMGHNSPLYSSQKISGERRL